VTADGVLLVGECFWARLRPPPLDPRRARCDAAGLHRSAGLVDVVEAAAGPRYTPTSSASPSGTHYGIVVDRLAHRLGDRQSRPSRGRRRRAPTPGNTVTFWLRGYRKRVWARDYGLAPGHAVAKPVLIETAGPVLASACDPSAPLPGNRTGTSHPTDAPSTSMLGSRRSIRTHCLGWVPHRHMLGLGCGGRAGDPSLVPTGFRRTAVYESAAMLAASRAPNRLHSKIEISPRPTFDASYSASFLVHAGIPNVCDAILRTCRRHSSTGAPYWGDPAEGAGWHERVPRESTVAGPRSVVPRRRRRDWIRSSGGVRVPGRPVTRPFASCPRPLGDAHFDSLLAARSWSLSDT